MNNDLIFIGKPSMGRKTQEDVDVSVTLVENRNAIAFSLSRKAITMMGGGQHFMIAKKSGRMYFRQASKHEGYKVTLRDNARRGMMRVPANLLRLDGENWIGHYHLLWDRERDLFYINIDLKD